MLLICSQDFTSHRAGWLHKAPFAALGGRLVGMERAVVRRNEGRGRTLGDDLAELTSFAVLKEL